MIVTIPTAIAEPVPNAHPALANIEIKTCSFTLNGPGLRENSLAPNPGIVNLFLGRTAAMKRPMGRVATWTVIWVMMRGSVRQAKNWFKKERRQQETSPKNHILKVHTGRKGSSVLGTVKRTCSIGDISSSSSASFLLGGEASIS